jgi:hypothetical protein
MNLEDHPTVSRGKRPPQRTWRTRLWTEHGCGAWRWNWAPTTLAWVEIERPGLHPQRAEILRNYSWTKSLLSLVLRMAREPVRGAPRSVANLEFHREGDAIIDA